MRLILWMGLLATALLLIMLSALLTLTRQAEPDSAWLVYVSATDQQIYRVRVDGAGQQRLTGMPFAAHNLAWSRAG